MVCDSLPNYKERGTYTFCIHYTALFIEQMQRRQCFDLIFYLVAIYPKFNVRLLKIDRFSDDTGIMTLVSEIAMIIYTIYFIVTECKEMKKQKTEYFKVFDNIQL